MNGALQCTGYPHRGWEKSSECKPLRPVTNTAEHDMGHGAKVNMVEYLIVGVAQARAYKNHVRKEAGQNAWHFQESWKKKA